VNIITQTKMENPKIAIILQMIKVISKLIKEYILEINHTNVKHVQKCLSLNAIIMIIIKESI
jgi:hypothetical protein